MRLTVDELRQWVSYDPETGIVKRIGRPRVRHGKMVATAHSHGYVFGTVGRTKCFMHRIAWALMTGKWPDNQIDHINGDRSDNRWCNLREANQKQNSANMKMRSSNKSGYKGVSPSKGRWAAFIHVDGKTKYLGRYVSPELAHKAYLAHATLAWGEYARAS